jgi:uncharacterized protein YdgA (DUF945 family)
LFNPEEDSLMKKATGVVAGVVIVVGAAWVGAAWYTGTRVETVVRQQVEQSNAKLQAFLPAAKMSFTVASLERHLFSTDVRYSFKVPGKAAAGKAAEDVEFIVVDHVEHGPFPLARLKSGQLAPVMATSHFALEQTKIVQPWFELTKGVAPFSGTASIGYDNDVNGVLTVQPVDFKKDDTLLKFSGMTVDMSMDKNKAAKVDGAVDTLSVQFEDPETKTPAHFDITGIALNSDMHPGKSGLQVGTNKMSVKTMVVAAGGKPAVTLTGYSQSGDLKEDDSGFAGTVSYQVGMINVDGKDFGSAQFGLGAKNLAPAAVKTLADLYGRILSRAFKTPMDPSTDAAAAEEAMALTPEERQQAVAAGQALLSGNPTFFIDPVVLKTAKGESRFNLNLDLANPGALTQPIDEIVANTIRKLDARLSISQPMVQGLMSQILQANGVDAATADKQAGVQTLSMGQMAVATGYATLQGSDVVATLHYADKTVDLNGKKMPLQEFAGMVLAGAMGMGGEQSDMDTPDEGEPDADEPEDDEQSTPVAPAPAPAVPKMSAPKAGGKAR